MVQWKAFHLILRRTYIAGRPSIQLAGNIGHYLPPHLAARPAAGYWWRLMVRWWWALYIIVLFLMHFILILYIDDICCDALPWMMINVVFGIPAPAYQWVLLLRYYNGDVLLIICGDYFDDIILACFYVIFDADDTLMWLLTFCCVEAGSILAIIVYSTFVLGGRGN